MTTRILPAPDIFASCPLDGNILEYYAGTFEAVYVCLNPFIKSVSIDIGEFKPGTYPNRATIARSCTEVTWVEVAQLAKLSSIAAVDIGLRTGIGGLKKELENHDFSRAIEALSETHGILTPQRDFSLPFFMTRSFTPYNGLGTTGFGLETSFALSGNCVGSMI